MFKINRLFLFLIITFCLGCQQQKDFLFKKEISLTGLEVKVKDILQPTSMFVYDSLLLIKEPPQTQKSIKILSLNDFRLISNAVWIGKGPDEIVNPAKIVIDKEDGVLWYSDWGKYKIFKFPIDSMVGNPDFKPNESFKIKRGLIPMMNMFYHPSGNFGFSSFNLKKNLVSFIDKNGTQIDSLAIPNKIKSDLWENSDFSDNPVILHFDPYYKKIVVAGRYENFIAVIDEEGNTIFQWNGGSVKSVNPKGQVGKYYTFYEIQSDQEFIYCLYTGGVNQTYDKESGHGRIWYPKKLLIFDWQGVGKYEINLDHELMYFVLDTERQRLIGNTQDFENGLVFYDLSGFKRNRK